MIEPSSLKPIRQFLPPAWRNVSSRLWLVNWEVNPSPTEPPKNDNCLVLGQLYVYPSGEGIFVPRYESNHPLDATFRCNVEADVSCRRLVHQLPRCHRVPSTLLRRIKNAMKQKSHLIVGLTGHEPTPHESEIADSLRLTYEVKLIETIIEEGRTYTYEGYHFIPLDSQFGSRRQVIDGKTYIRICGLLLQH